MEKKTREQEMETLLREVLRYMFFKPLVSKILALLEKSDVHAK